MQVAPPSLFHVDANFITIFHRRRSIRQQYLYESSANNQVHDGMESS